MKYLQKTWIRILISLIAGGFVTEVLHILTGDPNRDRKNHSSTLTLVVAFVTFLILTALVNRKINKI